MSIFAEIFCSVNFFVYICIPETKKETNKYTKTPRKRQITNTMKTKTTTTEMRKAAHKLITLCNNFDKAGDLLCKAGNCRDYNNAQEELDLNARMIEDLMKEMTTELNAILCVGDAIDIHDYYRLTKGTI